MSGLPRGGFSLDHEMAQLEVLGSKVRPQLLGRCDPS